MNWKLAALLASWSAFLSNAAPIQGTGCANRGNAGLLQLSTPGSKYGIVSAEGSLAAVSSEIGNKALKFQFEACNYPYMGYGEGTTRNAGHSMGAPLEYFGHLVRNADSAGAMCLTATAGDLKKDREAGFRFQPCEQGDGPAQLEQYFVLRIDAVGRHEVEWLGRKNLTSAPYDGTTYHWTLSKDPQDTEKGHPAYVGAQVPSSEHQMLLIPM